MDGCFGNETKTHKNVRPLNGKLNPNLDDGTNYSPKQKPLTPNSHSSSLPLPLPRTSTKSTPDASLPNDNIVAEAQLLTSGRVLTVGGDSSPSSLTKKFRGRAPNLSLSSGSCSPPNPHSKNRQQDHKEAKHHIPRLNQRSNLHEEHYQHQDSTSTASHGAQRGGSSFGSAHGHGQGHGQRQRHHHLHGDNHNTDASVLGSVNDTGRLLNRGVRTPTPTFLRRRRHRTAHQLHQLHQLHLQHRQLNQEDQQLQHSDSSMTALSDPHLSPMTMARTAPPAPPPPMPPAGSGGPPIEARARGRAPNFSKAARTTGTTSKSISMPMVRSPIEREKAKEGDSDVGTDADGDGPSRLGRESKSSGQLSVIVRLSRGGARPGGGELLLDCNDDEDDNLEEEDEGVTAGEGDHGGFWEEEAKGIERHSHSQSLEDLRRRIKAEHLLLLEESMIFLVLP